MPLIIQYLLKLSFSLTLVYLFYQLLLRKLTFYNCNRFYLLGYTALCFLIPLINITPALKAGSWGNRNFAAFIPAWQLTAYADEFSDPVIFPGPGGYWNLLLYGLIAGSAILVLLFCIRYISFLRIRKQARLLSEDGLKIYQVDKNIMPFSFGNAVFINHTLHCEDDLREIIRHEFVHVRQKHSVDILWAELLCMLNWYNPFVWLLRASIRQNLEFIADEQVVKSGLNKKQYQFMLLKVIGNNHFSIANQFNFSSLKKRIAMMNKDKTSKRQLLRLLLILPAVAVLLLAFRKQSISNDTIPAMQQPVKAIDNSAVVKAAGAEQPVTAAASGKMNGPVIAGPATAMDTIPYVNEKGYTIRVKHNSGERLVVITDKNGKAVKQILLTDWEKDKDHYEELYGEVPPPPPPAFRPPPPPPAPAVDAQATPSPAVMPPPPPALTVDAQAAPTAMPLPPPPPKIDAQAAPTAMPLPPPPPKAPRFPANVKNMQVNNGHATVTLKDGKKETYDLNNAEQKEAFEKKYGKLPEPPPPPSLPSTSRS